MELWLLRTVKQEGEHQGSGAWNAATTRVGVLGGLVASDAALRSGGAQ